MVSGRPDGSLLSLKCYRTSLACHVVDMCGAVTQHAARPAVLKPTHALVGLEIVLRCKQTALPSTSCTLWCTLQGLSHPPQHRSEQLPFSEDILSLSSSTVDLS